MKPPGPDTLVTDPKTGQLVPYRTLAGGSGTTGQSNTGGGMTGRITFPPNMSNPYTPRANPINITNPFTRPNQTIGFQPFPAPAPPSTAQTTIPNYSLPTVQPQPSQQKQSQLSMPNTLLKNPVTQGFSNPVQQPQRPRIYMPDFLGRRGSDSNWSDFLSIANLR